MRIDRIQDNGRKFILYGDPGIKDELEKIFSKIGLGISVTKSDVGAVNVLYTENNRDIVLGILDEKTENK